MEYWYTNQRDLVLLVEYWYTNHRTLVILVEYWYTNQSVNYIGWNIDTQIRALITLGGILIQKLQSFSYIGWNIDAQIRQL